MKLHLILTTVVFLFGPSDAARRKLRRQVERIAADLDDVSDAVDELQEERTMINQRLNQLETHQREGNESSCAAVAARDPGNCNDIRIQNPNAQSGEYKIFLPSNVEVTVYCDFLANHGYMFLSDNAISSITSLEGLYDITDHAVIRILYDNSEQHDVEIAQLMMNKYRFPLSFQLNSYMGYKRPVNWQMTPYVYVGFLPANRASLKSSMSDTKPVQGYMAGGKDITFINVDQNPNSYIAFFGNDGSVAESSYYRICCDSPTVRAWFNNDQLVPSSQYLPSSYFFFYEMHLGGNGGYFTSSHGVNYHISAATVGLGFEYKKCTPDDRN